MIAEDLAQTHKAAFTQSRPWSADEFAVLLIQKNTVTAGDKDSFVIGRVQLDEAEILTLATAPAKQRQGRAKAALADFIAQVKAKNVTTLFLEVAADNLGALALYEGAGFARVGLRQGYYRRADGPPCDAIVLQLSLPPR